MKSNNKIKELKHIINSNTSQHNRVCGMSKELLKAAAKEQVVKYDHEYVYEQSMYTRGAVSEADVPWIKECVNYFIELGNNVIANAKLHGADYANSEINQYKLTTNEHELLSTYIKAKKNADHNIELNQESVAYQQHDVIQDKKEIGTIEHVENSITPYSDVNFDVTYIHPLFACLSNDQIQLIRDYMVTKVNTMGSVQGNTDQLDHTQANDSNSSGKYEQELAGGDDGSNNMHG